MSRDIHIDWVYGIEERTRKCEESMHFIVHFNSAVNELNTMLTALYGTDAMVEPSTVTPGQVQNAFRALYAWATQERERLEMEMKLPNREDIISQA